MSLQTYLDCVVHQISKKLISKYWLCLGIQWAFLACLHPIHHLLSVIVKGSATSERF